MVCVSVVVVAVVVVIGVVVVGLLVVLLRILCTQSLLLIFFTDSSLLELSLVLSDTIL